MFDIYRDAAGYWRWRLVAGNNEIVAVSSEAYYSADGAEQSVQWVKAVAPSAPVHRRG